MKITKQYTNRESQSLDKYLQEIGKVELLSGEQEIELTKKIRAGGPEGEKALNTLVKANLRFVVSVAKQYQNQGLALGDLINEGNVGLMKAARRFDETRGFKFISYSVWWIRQTIIQALSEQSRIVRLPLNRVGSLNKINKEMNKLEQEYEREPTIEELSEQLNMDAMDIADTMKVSGKHLSVDAPIVNGEDSKLLDIIPNDLQPPPDSTLMHESLQIEIRQVLKTLSQREAEIVTYFYGLDAPQLTLEEIALKLGLTRERVRQIKEKAIRRLKTTKKKDSLRTYLG